MLNCRSRDRFRVSANVEYSQTAARVLSVGKPWASSHGLYAVLRDQRSVDAVRSLTLFYLRNVDVLCASQRIVVRQEANNRRASRQTTHSEKADEQRRGVDRKLHSGRETRFVYETAFGQRHQTNRQRRLVHFDEQTSSILYDRQRKKSVAVGVDEWNYTEMADIESKVRTAIACIQQTQSE